jgi:hypothetical protein
MLTKRAATKVVEEVLTAAVVAGALYARTLVIQQHRSQS